MDFLEYEQFTHTTAKYPTDQGRDLIYPALGLAGESGEYVEKIKKMLRDGHLDRDAAMLELGDVLFYLTRSAVHLGYSLEEVARRNISKLQSRLSRDVIGGEGDNR